jgi:hypothetical protein
MPGAVVTPGYGVVALTLTNGETLTATLLDEDDKGATVKLATGETRTISRSGIEAITPPTSTMPPLGLVLQKSELRDLIAYLRSLKEET